MASEGRSDGHGSPRTGRNAHLRQRCDQRRRLTSRAPLCGPPIARTTTYEYDALGALKKVMLPGGREIEYVLDATHRRVGKRVDGTLTRAYLYGNTLPNVGALARPLTYPYDTYVPIVAELDGTGALVSRFVYATKVNVPDYMIRGGTTYRLITDERGSVRLVVDVTTGDVAQRIDYDAVFGASEPATAWWVKLSMAAAVIWSRR